MGLQEAVYCSKKYYNEEEKIKFCLNPSAIFLLFFFFSGKKSYQSGGYPTQGYTVGGYPQQQYAPPQHPQQPGGYSSVMCKSSLY
jgi:hypothetical protein